MPTDRPGRFSPDRTVCNATWQKAFADNCFYPLYLRNTPYSIIINGFVIPPLVIVILATNSLICAVLLTRKMRSPSNTILVAMALSDMLTGVWTLPPYVYFYTLGALRDYVPYGWCFVIYWLTDYLPTVFHIASIWLTVALAAQRLVGFLMHI